MNCFEPSSQIELSDWIKSCASFQRSQIHWLNNFSESNNSSLTLSKLNAVIDYPYRDMTITVETGMTISALQAELKKHQQWLPVNVPFPEKTTLAEVICKNWFGSFSAGYGTMRDWLLGVTAIDGRGRIFHAGGRVVKNVAGYDVCKLLVGSQGKLAIPVELTLQVKPIPQQILVHRFQTESTSSLNKLWQQLRDLPFNPVIFDVVCPSTGNLQLVFAIEGSTEAVRSLSDAIQQTVTQENAKLISIDTWNPNDETWQIITNHSQPFALLRVGSLASQTINVLEIACKHHFIGFGIAARGMSVLRNEYSTETSQADANLKALQAELESLGVNIQSLNGEHQPIEPPLPLHKKIKAEFDPENLFV